MFTALLLSSLPFFFNFEMSPVSHSATHWGNVDGFVGAVAALGIACMIRSLQYQSWTWLFATIFFLNLTLFIKPAGALMMASSGLAWLLLGVFLAWGSAERRKSAWFVLSGGVLLGFSFVASILGCIHSSYLDKATFFYMLAGQSVLHKDSPSYLITNMWIVVGYLLPLFLLFFWMAFLFSLRSSEMRRLISKGYIYATPIAALGFFTLGAAFWINQPEPRYGFPFVMMAVSMTIPMVIADRAPDAQMGECDTWRFVMAQVINLGALLLPAHPSARWQRFSGVNLTSNGYRDEVAAAKQLLAKTRAQGSSATIYSLYSGPATYAFEAVGNFAATFEPTSPVLKFVYR